MSKVNELILAWAKRKYGERVPKETTEIRLEIEGRDDGFCETCSSPYSCVVVKAIHPPVTRNHKTRSGHTRTSTDTSSELGVQSRRA